MMDAPLSRHLARVCLSALIYAALAVLAVHLPALAARALAPGLFPLRLQLFDPLTQIPADMLVFHVLVPLVTIEHERLRAGLRAGLRAWLCAAGRPLGLEGYLLPPPEPAEAEVGGAAPPAGPRQPAAPAAAGAAEAAAAAAADPEAAPQADAGPAAAEPRGDAAAPAAGPPAAPVADQQQQQQQEEEGGAAARPQEQEQQQQQEAAAPPGQQPRRFRWRPWRRRRQEQEQQQQQAQAQQQAARQAQAAQPTQQPVREEHPQPAPAPQQPPQPQPPQQQVQEAAEAQEAAPAVARDALPAVEQPPQPQPQQQPQQPRRWASMAPPAPGAQPPPPPVEWYQARRSYPLQLLGLGAAGAATLAALGTACLLLPLASGRALFASAGLPVKNDLFSGAVGGLALWAAAAAAAGAARATNLAGLRAAGAAAGRWAVLSAKLAALILLWVGVVATLVGVLFELVLLPLRLPPNQTALIYLHTNWTFGVLALKLGHMLAVVRGRERRAGGRGGGGAAAANAWDVHLEALQAQGLRDLDFRRALTHVVLPALDALLVALAAPYVLTRGLLPLLGLPPRALQVAHLYGYAACHGLYLSCLASARLRAGLRELHNSIRDDRYLLGRRLNNLGAHAAGGGSSGGGSGSGTGGEPAAPAGAEAAAAVQAAAA
jgi:hypothetical protein